MQDDRSATDLSIETSRPVRAETEVVFTGDGVYSMQGFQQIRDLHPDRRFDICTAADDLPAAPPESLAHLDARRCTIRMFESLRLDPRRTVIVFASCRRRCGARSAGWKSEGVTLIDVALRPDQVGPPDESWMRRSLARHVLSQHRALRPMKRFPAEMTVLT